VTDTLFARSESISGMKDKHPRHSKSFEGETGHHAGRISEAQRKQMELGDAMEHEHGRSREETERDVEELDKVASHGRRRH